MCRYDECDDRPSVHRTKTVTTRKTHKCRECHRPIAPGETARYDFMIFDGNAESTYTCTHCLVGIAWLMENCGGWLFTEVTEEIHEHAEEYPELAMPLLRYTVAAGRKWKRFGSDDLMPVPPVMPSIASYFRKSEGA